MYGLSFEDRATAAAAGGAERRCCVRGGVVRVAHPTPGCR